MAVITGTVAFANLAEHEEFNGQSTGKYSVVVTLDDSEAEKLEAQGVKIKMYKNQAQRKFTTQFDSVDDEGKTNWVVLDAEDNSLTPSDITYGDIVKIKYAVGKPHPVHGPGVYLNGIRRIGRAEVANDADSDF